MEFTLDTDVRAWNQRSENGGRTRPEALRQRPETASLLLLLWSLLPQCQQQSIGLPHVSPIQ